MTGWVLHEPSYRTAPQRAHTFGPQVASICAQAGFEPDPEQSLVLDDLFAVTEAGESAAFENCVVAPRQAMKTGLMKQAAIGWLFVTEEETITWSAHKFATTQEAFLDLASLFTSSPMLRKRLANDMVDGIHAGNQDKHILLRDGRRLLFRARTNTGGRGLTGDKIILDEAFALTPEHIGALLPTLTVVPDPQVLYGSSAGLAYSQVLRDIRDRGRSGAPGLAYVEWCAERKSCASEQCEHRKPSDPKYEPGCALDDEELWGQAYPILGRRRSNGTGLTVERLRKFREAEPPAEFARERLGWWDEAGAADIFGPHKWELCAAEPPASSLPIGAFGVAVSFDQAHAAIVAAAAEGDLVHVKPMHHDIGSDWVAASLSELQRQYGVPVVIDGGGPGAGLIPHIEAAGVEHVVTKSTDVYDACAGFYELVRDNKLRHATYPELEAAVAGAQRRDVGDRWAWGRKQSESDISPLEAATLAAWKAAGPVKPEPVSAYEDHGVMAI